MALPADQQLIDLTLRALHALAGRAGTSDIDEAVFRAVSPPLPLRDFPRLTRRLNTVRRDLVDRGWLAHPTRGTWRLTERGAAEAATVAASPQEREPSAPASSDEARAELRPPTSSAGDAEFADGTDLPPPLVQRSTIAEPILDADERQEMGFPKRDDEPMTMIVELNLRHSDGLLGAREQFAALYFSVFDRKPDDAGIVLIADIYLRCRLSVQQAKELVAADIAQSRASKAPGSPSSKRVIYRVWPDFHVHPFSGELRWICP